MRDKTGREIEVGDQVALAVKGGPLFLAKVVQVADFAIQVRHQLSLFDEPTLTVITKPSHVVVAAGPYRA